MDSSSSRTPLDHIIEESRVDENSQSEISPSTEKKSVSSTETSPILRIQEESLSATSWVQPIDEWGAGSKEPTSVASNIIQTQEDEQENTKADSEETMHIPGDVGSVIDERNTNEKNYSSPDKSIEEVAEQTLHLQKQFACEDTFTHSEKQNESDLAHQETVSPEKEETIIFSSFPNSTSEEPPELKQENETKNFSDLPNTENTTSLVMHNDENFVKSSDTMTFEQIEQKIMSRKESLGNEIDSVGSVEAQYSHMSLEENNDVGNQIGKDPVSEITTDSKEEVSQENLEANTIINEEGRKITTEKHELPNDGKIRPNSATILSKGETRTLKPPTTRIFSAPKKTLASSMPKVVSPVVTRRLPAPTTRTSSTTRIPDSGIIASRSQSQPRAGSYTALNSLQTTPKVNKKYINVTSKIGSITDHKPSGGNVEIFSEKKVIVAKAKVGSMEKADHVPGGGNVKIENVRINFKEKAKPKVDSKSNHCAPKPEKKIISQKLNWNAQPKIGSMENAKHKPTGGNVKILNQKLEWSASSKVGSKANINHRPGGGNVQIFDERVEYVPSQRIDIQKPKKYMSTGGGIDILEL